MLYISQAMKNLDLLLDVKFNTREKKSINQIIHTIKIKCIFRILIDNDMQYTENHKYHSFNSNINVWIRNSWGNNRTYLKILIYGREHHKK